MKKRYSIVKVNDPALRKNPRIKTNDAYLQCITTMFRSEDRDYPRFLIRELCRQDMQDSGGCGGNYVDIDWEGKWVYVGNQFDEGELETRSKISKEKLFKLIDEYYELLKSNPENIMLCRDDNFNLWFETELPDFDKVKIDEKDRYKLYNPPDLE